MSLDFNTCFDRFLYGAQGILDKHQEQFSNKQRLVAIHGTKYIKIVSETIGSYGQSAWGFINKENGDVLKAATWKAPAKHARGNIFDSSCGLANIGPYGPAYLR